MPPSKIKKRGIQEPEDAAELKFGDEYDTNTLCLMTSEVAHLLAQQREERDADAPVSAVYSKTLAHVEAFKMEGDAYRQIRTILMRPDADLKAFEISQIGNLLPETAAQAKTLIPSLNRCDDDALQSLLDEVTVVQSANS